MKKEYKNNRVRTLKDITARHESREIEGCTSWRHFAVHRDREWLLIAMGKIRDQVEKIRQSESKQQTGDSTGVEIRKLLGMFEDETLNHLGDRKK